MSSGPLTDAEMVDVRRYCGYPVYGSGTTDDPYYRFETGYIQLESHMANLQPGELAQTRAKVANLQTVEAQFQGMSSSLVVDQAAVFKRNANEINDRDRHYRFWRIDLCGFLGVPPGPYLKPGNQARLIV